MNQRQIFGGEGSANEFRNCLIEANQFRAELGDSIVSNRPSAPIQVEVRAAYYCRVTDAYAGMYLSSIHGFDDRKEAIIFAGMMEQDELNCTILPFEARPQVEQIDDSDLPF